MTDKLPWLAPIPAAALALAAGVNDLGFGGWGGLWLGVFNVFMAGMLVAVGFCNWLAWYYRRQQERMRQFLMTLRVFEQTDDVRWL